MPMAIAMNWNHLTITCDGYRANFHLYLLKILIFGRIFLCKLFDASRLVSLLSLSLSKIGQSILFNFKMFLIHFVILRGMGTKSRYYREWEPKHISLGCFLFFAQNVKKIIMKISDIYLYQFEELSFISEITVSKNVKIPIFIKIGVNWNFEFP